jgi:hypothetical protein
VPLCRSAVPREPLRRAASAPFEPREAPSLVGAAKRPRGGATITAAAASADPDTHSTTGPAGRPSSPARGPPCAVAVRCSPFRVSRSHELVIRRSNPARNARSGERRDAPGVARPPPSAVRAPIPTDTRPRDPPAGHRAPRAALCRSPLPFARSRVSRSRELAPPPFEPREAPPLGGAAKRPPAWSDHHRCRCERLSRPTLDHPPTPRLRRAGPGRCGFPTVAAGRRIQPRKPRTGEPPP